MSKIYMLDEIKEIKLIYDFECVSFSRDVIRKFECHLSDKTSEFSLNSVARDVKLYVDLSYVDSLDDRMKTLLFSFSVWNIELITNNDEHVIIEVPTFNKDYFVSKDGCNSDFNCFEKHEKISDSYLISWYVDNDILNFNKADLVKVMCNMSIISSRTGVSIQVEVLDRLIKDKEKRKLILSNVCSYGDLIDKVLGVRKDCDFQVRSKDDVVMIFVDGELVVNFVFSNGFKHSNNGFAVIIYEDSLEVLDYCDDIVQVSLNDFNKIIVDIIREWYVGV